MDVDETQRYASRKINSDSKLKKQKIINIKIYKPVIDNSYEFVAYFLIGGLRTKTINFLKKNLRQSYASYFWDVPSILLELHIFCN